MSDETAAGQRLACAENRMDLRGRTRRGWLAAAIIAGLAVVVTAIIVLWRARTDAVTLSGPVAETTGLLGLDARTHRAFIVTGANYPFWNTAPALDTLDTTTGALLRTVRLGPMPAGLVVDAPANRVCVADRADGTVRLFDAHTGALLHTISLRPLAANHLAVDTRTGRLFVASILYNAVATLDVRTGALVRIVRDAGDVLAVDERTGRVFAFIANNGGGTDAIAVLDARSGRLLRSIALSPDQAPIQISITPAGPVVTGTSAFLLLDGQTGHIRKVIPMRRVQNTLGIAGEHVLVTIGSATIPHLSLLDPWSGRYTDTSVPVDATTHLAIDVRHEHAFVMTAHPWGDSGVWTVDARTGTIVAAATIPGVPVAVALDARANRVLIATQTATSTAGSVAVLDTRNGHLLRVLPLSLSPRALIMDEAAGRAIVVVGGGDAVRSPVWDWIPPGLRHWLPFLPVPTTRATPSRASILTLRGE